MQKQSFTPSAPQFEWLTEFESGYQFGEQGILAEIVNRLGHGSGRYTEVGAGDGDRMPVTLDKFYGIAWRFELWEADDANRAKLGERYPAARIKGKCDCLYGAAYGDGVVVIDVDGLDWWLWASLLASLELPRIAMVEHRDLHADQSETPLSLTCGTLQATTGQLIALAAGLMTPVGWTRVNTIFVRDDLIGALT